MKLRVALLFGGKSVEHEVSVISALQALGHLNREKYEPIPIYITKQNELYVGEHIGDIRAYRDIPALLKKSTRVILLNENGQVALTEPTKRFGRKPYHQIVDVALPVVHGTNVEDGTLQGYLQTLGLPYAGCDVLSSALGMDKFAQKLMFREAGVPVLDGKCYLKSEFYADESAALRDMEQRFSYPVIVKPVNLGSSVGIKKAADRKALQEALDLAFRFARRVLIEPAIVQLREINCAVLGDIHEAQASECEEPLGASDILSYEDKYMAGGKGAKAAKSAQGGSKGMASLSRKIPAELSPQRREEIRTLAVKAFRALGCSGVARIDFLLDGATDRLYLNEINTIPGSLSFYLWQPLGMDYAQLLDRLIELALKRERENESLSFSFETNLLQNANLGGSKGAKG